MTIQKAQSLLDDLKSEDSINLESMFPTWKLIQNRLRSSCTEMSEEDLEKFCKERAADTSSYLTQEVVKEREVLQGKINTLIKTVPMILTQSASSVAACTGTAAGAAVGVLGSAVLSAQSLKSMAKDVLQSSISAGIELPDSLGSVLETLKTLLKLSF